MKIFYVFTPFRQEMTDQCYKCLQLGALASQQCFSCLQIGLYTVLIKVQLFVDCCLILLARLLVNLVIFMLDILLEVIELLICGCLDLKCNLLEPCFDSLLLSVFVLQCFLHPYIDHHPDFFESL